MLSFILACAPAEVLPPVTAPITSSPTGTTSSVTTSTSTTSPTGSTSTTSTRTGTTPTTTTGATADVAVFDAMLSGALAPEDGAVLVAQSEGWPIDAGGGRFLFVHLAAGAWTLAGSWDGWAGTAMNQAAGFSWIELELPSPVEQIYKFTDGRAWLADPFARRFGYDGYGEFSLVRSAASHLERLPEVTDGVLDGRTVRVWVPEGGAQRTLFVHDGQNLFDPEAPWGGWRLQDSLGPGTMAVGIDNTWARMDEYTHVEDVIDGKTYGGQGDAYVDYVSATVRPLVERIYGATAVNGVMGSSLGGLISVHQVQRHPGTWDFVAGLSSTLGWGSIGLDGDTLIHRATGPLGAVVYLDSGGSAGTGCEDRDGDGVLDDGGGGSDNYCVTRQMADQLAAVGHIWNEDLVHWWEPDAEHNEAAWAERAWRPVELFEGL